MVRASTSGMIDFRRFDPWDSWWWKNLRWIINELETQQTRDICRTQHTHWITLASHGNLTDDSFEKAKTNAGTAFNKLLKATFPWLADKIGEDGTKTDREEAIAAHQEMFGKPGDPHYEAMVTAAAKALSKGPLSAREKEKDRARRRARRAQQAAENGS